MRNSSTQVFIVGGSSDRLKGFLAALPDDETFRDPEQPGIAFVVKDGPADRRLLEDIPLGKSMLLGSVSVDGRSYRRYQVPFDRSGS